MKADRFNDQLFSEILKGLRRYVGEEMDFKVEFVDSIPMIRTGKHQATISELKLDFQKLDQRQAAAG